MYTNHFIFRFLIVSTVVLQSVGFVYQATAQTTARLAQITKKASILQHSTLVADLRFTARYQGAPRTGRARGGASRGVCPVTNLPLVSLVPTTVNAGASLELTTSDRPSFWFYVPFALNSERSAEFSLLDADGNYVYNAVISASPDQPGVIKVKLPTSTKSLATDQTYTWIFQIDCGMSNPISTWGEIKRVALDPTLLAQLQQSNDREKAALYAKNGIWYEAVNTLAELRLADPTNQSLMADWQSLLESVGLADIAEQPLLACCLAN